VSSSHNKYVELIEIISKLLLLHLVDCLHYYIIDARSHKYQINNTCLAGLSAA